MRYPRFACGITSLVLTAIALVGLAGCGAAPRAIRPVPERTELSQQTVVVPLLPSARGTPRVAVLANGATPGEMVLDTGAFASLVSPDFAAGALAPVRGSSARSVDAGGNVRAVRGVARFDSLHLGAATFHGLDAVVQDVSVLGRGDRGSVRRGGNAVGGAIGMPVFRDVLLTVDYPQGRLVIERGDLPPPNGRDVLPMAAGPGGRPMVRMAVGGRPLWVLLDTGFSAGLGIPWSARRLVLGAEQTVAGAPFEYYHGQGQSERARLTDDLEIGWHVVRRPIVDVGIGSVPVIGAEYLRHFAVTLDQRNGRVRFARADVNPIRVPPVVGPGFYVDLDTAVVIAVMPASGADRAGLRVGDRLLTVEGIPFDTYRTLDAPRVARQGHVSLTFDRAGTQRAASVPVTVLLP